ncbi:MAG: hypothetical protein ABW034_19575, partial [Steroidobacteraceae bacterium]
MNISENDSRLQRDIFAALMIRACWEPSMFGLDLPRTGLLIGVGVIHAVVVVAFAHMTRAERINKPTLVMETLFLSTHEPEEVLPPPLVTIEPVALRISTSAPLLNV